MKKFEEAYERHKRAEERAAACPKPVGHGEARRRRERETEEARLFSGPSILARYTERTKERIMERGTAREMAALRIADYEAGLIVHCERLLTDAEVSLIITRIAEEVSEEERAEYEFLLSTYNHLARYESEILSLYRTAQAEEAELIILVNKWNTLMEEAENLTEMLRARNEGEEDEVEQACNLFAVLEETGNYGRGDGYRFSYDYKTDAFRAVIDEEGGMYGEILYRAEKVRNDMAMLKGAINAIVSAILPGDYFLPVELERLIVETWEETYIRTLIDSPKFLRSEVIRRRAEGETVTEEEERAAVVPCFDEVAEDRAARKAYTRLAWRCGFGDDFLKANV